MPMKRPIPQAPRVVDRGGNRPIGANATIGALRFGLAIGEVQALLNPHVGSGECGLSAGSPGQWTVVDITLGGHFTIIFHEEIHGLATGGGVLRRIRSRIKGGLLPGVLPPWSAARGLPGEGCFHPCNMSFLHPFA